MGSTATVLYQTFLADEQSVSKRAAYLIASAILSDTKNLTSNTTTEFDRKTLVKTAKAAGISNVDDLTFENRGMEHLFTVVKNRKDNQSVIIGWGDGSSDILTQAYGSDEYLFKPAASRNKDIVPKLREVYKAVN